MFLCPACRQCIQVVKNQDVSCHLNHHKLWGELKFPIECKQNGCLSTFGYVSDFVKHFTRFHGSCFGLSSEVSNLVENTCENIEESHNCFLAMEEDESTGEQPAVEFDSVEAVESTKSKLEIELMNAAIKWRSKSNLPLNASVDSMQTLGTIIDVLVDDVIGVVKQEFGPFKSSEIDAAINKVTTNLGKLKTVATNYKSDYKLKKLFDNHPRFLNPEPIVIGHRFESRSLGGKMTYVSKPNLCQFITLSRTITALFENSFFEDAVFPSREDCVGIRSFFNSQRFRTNPFFQENWENSLYIQLYYDGLGLTNPLRGAAQAHGSGMFYFTILNLPPRYNAALANIHLLAVCNSLDLKYENGMRKVLSKVVNEFKVLGESGLTVKSKIHGARKILVKLAQFTADNLGLHQVFEMIESFAHDYCCIFCYATKQQMQCFFEESSFVLRTKKSYLEDLQKLAENGGLHFRGLKGESPINDLHYFNQYENRINDCMHTLLEGVIPCVTGCILSSMSSANSKLNFEEINDRTNALFSLLVVDRKNKPPELDELLPPGKGLASKMSAAQLLAFSKFLPLILSDFVTEETEDHYEFFLLCQEMVDIILAHLFVESLLQYLTYLIRRFLVSFKYLYPELNITPKFHFLVHYPSIIRNNGPPRTYWTLHYERLNGSIKIPCHIMNNFKDPQKTVAYRRQCAALNASLEMKGDRNFIFFHEVKQIPISTINSIESFDSLIRTDEDYLNAWKKIEFNGTLYSTGMIVLLKREDDYLVFGEVIWILYSDEPIFLVNVLPPSFFDVPNHSFIIDSMSVSERSLIKVSSLLDYHPLDKVKKNGITYVRLHYYV